MLRYFESESFDLSKNVWLSHEMAIHYTLLDIEAGLDVLILYHFEIQSIWVILLMITKPNAIFVCDNF